MVITLTSDPLAKSRVCEYDSSEIAVETHFDVPRDLLRRRLYCPPEYICDEVFTSQFRFIALR